MTMAVREYEESEIEVPIERLFNRGGTGDLTYVTIKRSNIPAVRKYYRSLWEKPNMSKKQVISRSNFLKGVIDRHARLDHPHIVKLYGYVRGQYRTKEDEVVYVIKYILMERVLPNMTWSNVIEDAINDPDRWLSRCMCVFRTSLLALEYMHRNNFIHRDVKCDNFVISSNNATTLIDMDEICEITTNRSMTPDVGTHFYAAPEVYHGGETRTQYGVDVDMWAFGCLIIRLIVNSPRIRDMLRRNAPMHELSDDDIRMAIAMHRRSLPIFEKLFDIAERCINRDPNKRITASEALAILAEMPSNLEPITSDETLPELENITT